ncbi:MAG TPA: alpha/beta fold hydrolase [Polyangia bacterium]|nr:alpha/beta fold hydrolase [Polyangia bacterium]
MTTLVIPNSGRFDLPVAHGRLEAILKESAAPTAAVVVCHPHPQGGGTMNNNVVYRVAAALGAAGASVLRFNFRGVGRSTGSYDHGVGEEDDARDALDFLAGRYLGVPLWMAGFSFGARVGLTVGAGDDRVQKLLGVGLALKMFDYGFLVASPKPKAIVQAADDEYGGRDAITAAVAGMAEPRRLWVVDGTTHLFPGHLDELEQAAKSAVAFLLAAG